jgi:hypothetical protein
MWSQIVHISCPHANGWELAGRSEVKISKSVWSAGPCNPWVGLSTKASCGRSMCPYCPCGVNVCPYAHVSMCVHEVHDEVHVHVAHAPWAGLSSPCVSMCMSSVHVLRKPEYVHVLQSMCPYCPCVSPCGSIQRVWRNHASAALQPCPACTGGSCGPWEVWQRPAVSIKIYVSDIGSAPSMWKCPKS